MARPADAVGAAALLVAWTPHLFYRLTDGLGYLGAGRLPAVRTDPVRRAETLLEVREGGAATVAVVRRGEHLGITVDTHYTLGSTRGHGLQQRQAHFPRLLHPEPRRVFLLGMGTGITAGAALALLLAPLIIRAWVNIGVVE